MAQTAIFTHLGSVIDGTHPLSFGPLNADTNTVSAGKAVIVKVPASYASYGNVTIDATGTSDAKFQLSPASDFSGAPAYGAALTVTGIDATTGVTFYVRAKATAGETAQTDTSVTFSLTGEVVAA
jgi:hypothetical protein